MISEEVLSILVCPKTKESLSLASSEESKRINDAVNKRTLSTVEGRQLVEAFDGYLIRVDRKLVYPIKEGIPVLLQEEGIPLSDGII